MSLSRHTRKLVRQRMPIRACTLLRASRRVNFRRSDYARPPKQSDFLALPPTLALLIWHVVTARSCQNCHPTSRPRTCVHKHTNESCRPSVARYPRGLYIFIYAMSPARARAQRLSVCVCVSCVARMQTDTFLPITVWTRAQMRFRGRCDARTHVNNVCIAITKLVVLS